MTSGSLGFQGMTRSPRGELGYVEFGAVAEEDLVFGERTGAILTPCAKAWVRAAVISVM